MSDLGCGRAGGEAGGPHRIITSAKVSSNTVIPGYQRVRGRSIDEIDYVRLRCSREAASLGWLAAHGSTNAA